MTTESSFSLFYLFVVGFLNNNPHYSKTIKFENFTRESMLNYLLAKEESLIFFNF